MGYSVIPLYLALAFVLGGLFVLTKSADVFVEGSAALARRLGIKPFIVGMVIIGFGTSAPELCVSVLSGISSHSNLSLGNAYGSCVFNLAAVLGVAALIRPLVVKPSVNMVGVPLLLGITLFSMALICKGGGFSRTDGLLLLGTFAVLLPLYCLYDQRTNAGAEPSETEEAKVEMTAVRAALKVLAGLVMLVASSHFLVWGAVDIARKLGVSELMIGLTVVGVGTSLPELASAVASARRGEHEFVLGNIVGSNFFNMLAVVGLAGSIAPFREMSPYILWRDIPAMLVMTLALAVFGVNWHAPRKNGRINRWEGALWLLFYIGYLLLTLAQEHAL